MSTYMLPAIYALVVWWIGTGLILVLVGLPRSTYKWSLAVATVGLAAALYWLGTTRADAGDAGAYAGFTAAVLVWTWPEMAFLMGVVTGPVKRPCPPEVRGSRRFGLAVMAILYHELALVTAGALVAVVAWGGPNWTGVATFAVLWLMRLSAKLNLFLGVRTSNEELLPAHLGFLRSFFAARPINPLFPVSIAASVAGLAFIVAMASAHTIPVSAAVLLGTLIALGILEHGFMIMPWRVAALWGRDSGPARPSARTLPARPAKSRARSSLLFSRRRP